MTLARKLQLGLVGIGILVLAVPVGFVLSRLHFGEALEPAAAAYPEDAPSACEEGTRAGTAGGADREETAGGIRFSVRVPTNYRVTAAHPLIVVYAPRGANRFLLERFVGLTREATAAGFVIAYADARDLSLDVVRDLATIPSLVSRRWCIDPDRVSLTGHSDGGTVASAIAFRPETRGLAASIAPSAAGLRATDLLVETCPPPLSVLVLHGRDDSLFPGYGAEAARWWATCNGCDVDAARQRDDGCVEHSACDDGVETLFCEHEAGHLDWPARSPMMIEMFARSRRAPNGARTADERRSKETRKRRFPRGSGPSNPLPVESRGEHPNGKDDSQEVPS